MAPSIREIESALRVAIQETIDEGKEELLTVRYIRNKVTESLKLDEGFFVTDDWKSKSKEFIQKNAAELLDAKEKQQLSVSIEGASEPVKKEAAPPKKSSPKRAAPTDKSRPTKRRKKEATPSEEEEEEEELSELSEEGEEESPDSEFDDSDISDAPKPKKKTNSKPKAKANAAPKRQTKKRARSQSDESDEESEALTDVEDSDAVSPPPKKLKQAKKDAPKKRKSRDTIVESEEESEEEKPAKISKSPEKTKSPTLRQRKQPQIAVSDDNEESKPDTNLDTAAHDSDSSEMSVVLDEAPKSKKRSRNPNPETSKTSKPKSTSKPAPKELSLNEALIKTLQSQLVKCGVRKIWAFELKQYHDDSKAKIRHLQGMLKDIGMTGRFSEQRAREIKELRELQADLEAVKEGDKQWGLESGRRARGGMRKSLKESSGEDDEDEDGNGEGGGAKDRSRSASENPSKVARAKQELAFLGMRIVIQTR